MTGEINKRRYEYLYNIADRHKATLILVKVSAPPSLVQERLQARHADRLNKSDADWSVYGKMLPTVEEIRGKHFTVDTSQDISAKINQIVREAIGKSKQRR